MNDALVNKTEESAAENVALERVQAVELNELPEENIFLSSLRELKEEDIDLNETAKNVKKAPVDFVRYFILLVCVSVFVYTGFYIVNQLFQYAEAANDNSLFRDIFYGDAGEELGELGNLRRVRANQPIPDILSLQRQTVREVVAVTHEGIGEAEQRRVRFDRLRASGMTDIYGWLRVSGTHIDYPVVQSCAADPEFYLRRNPFGNDLIAGSLFADYRNDRNVDNNWNTIIYGHNMANRTKFSDLMRFRHDRELFDNALIELTTPDGVYIYEVFSAHTAHERFFFREVEFNSSIIWEGNELTADEWRVTWFNLMKNLSGFTNERVTFTPESRIITLQTCTNTFWNPRFVVHGVLVEVRR